MAVLAAWMVSASEANADESMVADGLIAASASAKVPSKINGVVQKLAAKENSMVKEGDPILILDDTEQRLELEARKAIATKADADAKINDLLFQENVASRDERDRAKVEAQTAQANFEISKLKFDHCTVRSPIAGRVLRVTKGVGEAVQALETVAEVADLENVEIIVYLDAAYMGRIRTGDSVMLDDQIAAAVAEVDSVVDPGSGIFRVKIHAGNPDNLLISGKRCKVAFSLASKESGLDADPGK